MGSSSGPARPTSGATEICGGAAPSVEAACGSSAVRVVRKRSEFFDGDVMNEETSSRVALFSSLGSWTKAENCNEPDEIV